MDCGTGAGRAGALLHITDAAASPLGRGRAAAAASSRLGAGRGGAGPRRRRPPKVGGEAVEVSGAAPRSTFRGAGFGYLWVPRP